MLAQLAPRTEIGRPIALPSPRGAESRRALVLLDRPRLADLIQQTLNHGIFVVQVAGNLDGAEAILSGWQPDLAIVDMDRDDAPSLLSDLGVRSALSTGSTPVLGLTRWSDVRTRLRAFDLGVDDILGVPFEPAELLARSIVIARRTAGADHPFIPTITIDDLEIDLTRREVRTHGTVTHLSEIEQKMLHLLAGHLDHTFSRDEILDAVWGPDFVAESNVVDRHVRSLRSKLLDDCRHPRVIATVRGEGYRFVATFSNAGWSTGPVTGPDATPEPQPRPRRPARPVDHRLD